MKNFILISFLLLLLSCSTTKQGFKFIPTEECKICDELATQPIESRNDTLFNKYKDLCSKYYEYLGDEVISEQLCDYNTDFNPYFYKQSLYYYQKAHDFNSNDYELNLKLASIYDFQDSVNITNKLYSNLPNNQLIIKNTYEGKVFSKVNIQEIKRYFFIGDSLKYYFENYPEECSLTFNYSRKNAGSFFDFISKSYYNDQLKIEGDGLFSSKIRDKNNREQIQMNGIIPQEILFEIIQQLQKLRIFSFNNQIFKENNPNNELGNYPRSLLIVDSEDLYNVLIIQTPSFKFKVSIENLYLTTDEPDFVEEDLNYPKYFKLRQFWKKYFCNDFLKQYETKE